MFVADLNNQRQCFLKSSGILKSKATFRISPYANIVVLVGCFQELVEEGPHKLPASLCYRPGGNLQYDTIWNHTRICWRLFACGQRGCNRCQALAASSPLSWGSPLSPWKWFYKKNIPSRKLESHLILSHSFFNFLKIQLSVLYCNLKYNCFLTFLHRFSLIHFEELFQDLFFFLKIVENFRQILRDSLCFSDRLFQATC